MENRCVGWASGSNVAQRQERLDLVAERRGVQAGVPVRVAEKRRAQDLLSSGSTRLSVQLESDDGGGMRREVA
jgi:hypothetical protein